MISLDDLYYVVMKPAIESIYFIFLTIVMNPE